MSQRVTLKDVAKLAEVSYQTVSKVLRGTISVSSDTSERIYRAIDELGYTPNRAAQNLRMAQSRTIGYSWLPSPDGEVNPVLESFLEGMMTAAAKHDYELLCFPGRDSAEEMKAKYQTLYSAGRVDGFVLSNVEGDDFRVEFLKQTKIPFAAFGRSFDAEGYPFVDVDGGAGMQAVVKHVVQSGYRKLLLLAWIGTSRVGRDRVDGFLGAVRQDLLESNYSIEYGAGTVASGYCLTLNALREKSIDAVVALNDLMAIGAMKAIEEAGLKVGMDIGVTGFDDFPMAQHCFPPLTSVRQPSKIAGETVIELLIDVVENQAGNKPWENYILEPELMIRQSTVKMNLRSNTKL